MRKNSSKGKEIASIELCPFCGSETLVRDTREHQMCSHCGRQILPCSFCYCDTTLCSRCPYNVADNVCTTTIIDETNQ